MQASQACWYGIKDPVFNAPIAFERSQLSTKMLTEASKTGQSINLTEYENNIIAKKNQAQVLKDTQTLQEVQDILQRFPCDQKSSIQRKLHSKCSSWLTIVPTNDNGFSMSLGMQYPYNMGNNQQIYPLVVMLH